MQELEAVEAKEILNNDLTTSMEGLQEAIVNFLQEKEKNIEALAKIPTLLTGVFTFVKIFSTLFIKNFENLNDLHIKNKKLYIKDVPAGNASLQFTVVNIDNEEDDRRLTEATSRYLAEISNIKNSIKKNNENITSDFDLLAESQKFQFIYSLSALFNKN